MNATERRVCAWAAIVLATGCGASGSEGESSEDQHWEGASVADATEESASSEPPDELAVEATREAITLNSFEAGGEMIEFKEAFDGSVVLSETTSVLRKGYLSQRLTAEVGELTMLEKFFALAPEGEVPHERLVASHLEDVAALERADDSIRRVDFDTEQAIEKSIAACDDAFEVNGQSFNLRIALFNRSGTSTMCLGPAFSCTHMIKTHSKIFQWCNDTSSSLSPTVGFGNTMVWFGQSTFGSVASGQKYHLEFGPAAAWTRYYMRGSSTSSPYHMEAGTSP